MPTYSSKTQHATANALRQDQIVSLTPATNWFACYEVEDGNLLLPLCGWALVRNEGIFGMIARDHCKFAELADNFQGYEYHPDPGFAGGYLPIE